MEVKRRNYLQSSYSDEEIRGESGEIICNRNCCCCCNSVRLVREGGRDPPNKSFSQTREAFKRVLLTLEEKPLPYDMKLVDFAEKNRLVLKDTEAKISVIKIDENWIADTDIIISTTSQVLDEKLPNSRF